MFRRFRIAVLIDTTVVLICNLHLYLYSQTRTLIGSTQLPSAMAAMTMSSALTTSSMSAGVARRPAPRVQPRCTTTALFRPRYNRGQCQPNMNAWRAAANRYGQGRMSQQDLEDVMRVRLLSCAIHACPAAVTCRADPTKLASKALLGTHQCPLMACSWSAYLQLPTRRKSLQCC